MASLLIFMALFLLLFSWGWQACYGLPYILFPIISYFTWHLSVLIKPKLSFIPERISFFCASWTRMAPIHACPCVFPYWSALESLPSAIVSLLEDESGLQHTVFLILSCLCCFCWTWGCKSSVYTLNDVSYCAGQYIRPQLFKYT